jgi:tetratricopeptide (TPR) repeat protein
MINMLSAFIARPIVELKQKGIKITSILAHSDQLLVGLNTGVLRVYRVKVPDEGLPNASEDDREGDADGEDSAASKQNGNTHNSAELLREYEKFSKVKIEQLAIFREANILISLSGGIVSLHDLASFELNESLSRTKGAACFAAASNVINDEKSGGVNMIVSRLAVAVKRRLLIWEWQDGEMIGHEDSDGPEEITLVSSVKSLTWASDHTIVAGLQGQYYLVNVESKEVKPIVGPGAIGGQETSKSAGYGAGTMSYIGMGSMIPDPLATELGEKEMLLARDVNSLFIDKDGEPLQRRQVPWKIAPEAVGYSYPYLLALQESSRGVLEVRNPTTLTLLQTVSLPEARILQTPNRGVSLAHQGKGFLVASERVVWRMSSLGYDAQVDELVEHSYLDEAISLLEMVEHTLVKDSTGRLREIKMIKAGMLFKDKRFRDALDLFSEVEATPERVIALYPEVIAGDSAQLTEEPQEIQQPISPVKLSVRGHRKTDSTASGAGSLKGSPSKSTSKKTSPEPSAETASIKAASIRSTNQEGLSETELKMAVRELQAFLADVRRRLQRFFDADQNVKDTPDVQTAENHQTLSHLLDLPDVHDVDLTEKLLSLARLVDTTLFRVYMYATPSLAGSLFRIANFCDPGVVMEKLEETARYSELIDFLYGKRLHRQALERLQKFGQADSTEEIDPQLHGPGRTVAYLQNLPPELVDLILEFSKWPLEKDPNLGMEIFLADTENAENLPRMKVFAFLEGEDHKLALRYLEHVIDELNDQNPELHQKLLDLYLECLKESPNEDVQTKFLTLLKSSTMYSPSKILQLLPNNDPIFYEARALVLSKMGNHRQALEIYVFRLDDPKKAEEYCNTVHLEETLNATKRSSSRERRKAASQAHTTDPLDEKPSMYGILLNLYLNPPRDEEKRWGPAIEILARHGARLPASSTLEMIPKDLLVKELEFYFRGRIRNANTITTESQVVAGLRKVEAVRAQAGLLLGDKGRQRKVRVDDERVCPVCHKRLGGSVISVFPDNSVVHLGCQSRRQTDTAARS